MLGATTPSSSALARIAVMSRFLIGRRHHEYSLVPQARFTPCTSAWKKRSALQTSTTKAIKPALFRDFTTPSIVVMTTFASCDSSGMYLET